MLEEIRAEFDWVQISVVLDRSGHPRRMKPLTENAFRWQGRECALRMRERQNQALSQIIELGIPSEVSKYGHDSHLSDSERNTSCE